MGRSKLLIRCGVLWLGALVPSQLHLVTSFSFSPAASFHGLGPCKFWSDQTNILVLRSKFDDGEFSSRKDENEEDDSEEEDLITKEQFYRDLMGLSNEDNIKEEDKKPKKKNKNAKQARRVNHDNRDELPFLVQVITPPDKAYEKELAKQLKTNKKKKQGSSPVRDLETVTETLGEFRFDKSTNSGDKIEIDNEVYLVQRSKCQYKYAGAQKFVMVRKILQVKPIQRAMQEDYLKRQWNAPPAPDVL